MGFGAEGLGVGLHSSGDEPTVPHRGPSPWAGVLLLLLRVRYGILLLMYTLPDEAFKE